jgi:predicted Zn-dependent peptidase
MTKKTFLVEKKDAMQSGVRLGRILFNQEHEDFGKMRVVNTILGGYFGSRLMKNIREDKGYTYGIGSALLSLKETGYFTIVSEVNAKFSQATIQEIKKEIKILQTDLVSEEELAKVKSYMLGRILRSVDGPFALSETFLNVWLYNMNWDYYKEDIKTIQNISAEEIKLLTNRYLNEEDLIEVIAGK